MSTARNGRDREYRARDWMISHGWRFIMRASASKGSADLLMAHPVHGAALVQVGSSNKSPGPAERARMMADAQMAGALALVVREVGKQGQFTCHEMTLGTPGTWAEWTDDDMEGSDCA